MKVRHAIVLAFGLGAAGIAWALEPRDHAIFLIHAILIDMVVTIASGYGGCWKTAAASCYYFCIVTYTAYLRVGLIVNERSQFILMNFAAVMIVLITTIRHSEGAPPRLLEVFGGSILGYLLWFVCAALQSLFLGPDSGATGVVVTQLDAQRHVIWSVAATLAFVIYGTPSLLVLRCCPGSGCGRKRHWPTVCSFCDGLGKLLFIAGLFFWDLRRA